MKTGNNRQISWFRKPQWVKTSTGWCIIGELNNEKYRILKAEAKTKERANRRFKQYLSELGEIKDDNTIK